MAPVLLTATILTATITIILSMLGLGRWAGYFFPHWWARLFCVMSMVKVTVKGRENIDPHTSYVFIANHQGAYDIFSKATMEKAEKQLRGGMSLVVFPEGARTWDGKMRRFKRGAFVLAMEFGLPVVPITIDGSFEVMPRFKKIPDWGHITLTIHKPIEAVNGKHDLLQLLDGSYATIHDSLPERHK